MRRYILFSLACAIAIVAWSDSAAQSTGTVTVTGVVNPSAAIRWSDWSPINAEVGGNAPDAWNAPLDFTLNMGDLAAGNNLADYAGGSVQVILRSNAPYVMSGDVTNSAGFGSVANGDLALTDVGFGITSLANSGPKVFGSPANDATIAGGFDSDPSSAPKDIDEEPIFNSTLADIAAPTQLIDGPRISNRGGRGSPNNGLLVDLGFAAGPQYYTPVATFSTEIEFTLATP